MSSPSGHPRCKWVCFFIWTDLKKCSIPSLAHQWILCSEWVPSEWESKQLIKSDNNPQVIHTTPVLQLSFCLFVGMGDILHAICMRISSVKPVPWLALNLHHLFSDGAVFNTQSRSHWQATHISTDISTLIWTRYCVACQWFTALCIKCRSIWKQVMEI